jgi:hypothetical protein
VGLALEIGLRAIFLRAELNPADIGELDLVGAARGEHQIFKLRHLGHAALNADRKLAGAGLDASAGDLDILLAQGALDVADRQLMGGQLVAVHPQAHGVTRPADTDRADPGNGLQALDCHPLDEFAQLKPAVTLGAERQGDDRRGVGVGLGDLRLLDLVGQAAASAADPVAHVVGGLVHVAVEVELDGDAGGLLLGIGADDADAVDGGDLALQRLGDLGLHHLGGGAAVSGFDGDDRRVDERVFAHR